MAADEFPPPFLKTPVKTPAKALTVPAAETVLPVLYANTWRMRLGDSDITITFGVTGDTIDDNPGSFNPVTTFALSHSQFVKLADELHRATMILEKMYEGSVPRMNGLTTDRLNAAAAEVNQELQNIESGLKNK